MILKLAFFGDKGQIKQAMVIMISFWAMFYGLYLLEMTLHGFLSRFIEIRSEYTISEQSSKLFLFLTMLIALYAYQALREPGKVKLSLSFFLFGISLYMSESNMISNTLQPVIGIVFLGIIFILLWYDQAWLSFVHFGLGILMILLGVFADFIGDEDKIRALTPSFITESLAGLEERFDAAGMAFFFLATVFCFRPQIRSFISKNKKTVILLIVTSALLTSGNGLLHWQYKPTGKLQLFALTITLCGFIGLVLFNKYLNNKQTTFTLVRGDLFYLFIFGFFVILPSVYGNIRLAVDLLIWIPFFVFLAIALWQSHPSSRAIGRK